MVQFLISVYNFKKQAESTGNVSQWSGEINDISSLISGNIILATDFPKR